MNPLKVLFNIQGEGRGHIMQAVALAEILRDAGHTLVAAHVGQGEKSTLPPFVSERLETQVKAHNSPALKLDLATKRMDTIGTATSTLKRFSKYAESIRGLNLSVRETNPDVIVNFYEPLIGFRSEKRVPMVAIAHQYMFYHPSYPFNAETRFRRWGVRTFTDFTARSADKLLALSLCSTYDLPERKLKVVPPLLRRSLFELKSEISHPGYYLAYVWRAEFLKEIRDWCRDNPLKNVHCFVAGLTTRHYDKCPANLFLHALDDTLFLELMASSSGVATTAGFETCAEAYFLDKPILMVPTHLEQKCNAMDAVALGGAVMSNRFKLDSLETISCAETRIFQSWVYGAPEMILSEIEKTSGRVDQRKHVIVSKGRLPKSTLGSTKTVQAA